MAALEEMPMVVSLLTVHTSKGVRTYYQQPLSYLFTVFVVLPCLTAEHVLRSRLNVSLLFTND